MQTVNTSLNVIQTICRNKIERCKNALVSNHWRKFTLILHHTICSLISLSFCVSHTFSIWSQKVIKLELDFGNYSFVYFLFCVGSCNNSHAEDQIDKGLYPGKQKRSGNCYYFSGSHKAWPNIEKVNGNKLKLVEKKALLQEAVWGC